MNKIWEFMLKGPREQGVRAQFADHAGEPWVNSQALQVRIGRSGTGPARVVTKNEVNFAPHPPFTCLFF